MGDARPTLWMYVFEFVGTSKLMTTSTDGMSSPRAQRVRHSATECIACDLIPKKKAQCHTPSRPTTAHVRPRHNASTAQGHTDRHGSRAALRYVGGYENGAVACLELVERAEPLRLRHLPVDRHL